MSGLTADVSALGAVPGVDCGPLVTAAIARGARDIFYPPGLWTQNNVDLTGHGTTTRISVRGVSPASTSIITSVAGASVFMFIPPIAQEAFIDISGLELINGPGQPNNSQSGYGIVVVGPVGTEIGKGNYRNLWGKNFARMLNFERHNSAHINGVISEYCTTAVAAIDCGDLELIGVNVYQGNGAAIWIAGTPAGQANHMAEGARITSCSSNTQKVGIVVESYNFVHMTTSSFSTCSNYALYLDNVSDMTIVGGEYQNIGDIAMAVSPTCHRIRMFGAFPYGSGRGLVLAGSNHSIHGLHGVGNIGPDITLSATDCDIVGGQLLSVGAVQSLLEIAPAARNKITSMKAVRNVVLIPGNGSVLS